MSRIEQKFISLKALNKKAFISFIMGGDPDFETSLNILKSLPEAGADIIEIGMPFADPMADGPTIQAAGERSLAAGGTIKSVFEMVRIFRENDTKTPIVLMGYANPLYKTGLDQFCAQAKAAGVDGLIIVDLPPEESADLIKATKEHGLDFIRLVAPTTTKERLPQVLTGASGFIYYVSVAGITGTKSVGSGDIEKHIKTVRGHTNLPLAIGFGIKTPDQVKDMASLGDAVVVGSALVKTIEVESKDTVVEKLCDQIRALSGVLR